ncbi:AAA family ATPase (plasmid) [Paraburkholderia strydomiana]
MVSNNPSAIPIELRERVQWINWKYDTDDKGKQTKRPLSPRTGRVCDATDPKNWAPFDVVINNAINHGVGIGFALSQNDPYVVIDSDSPEAKGLPVDECTRIHNTVANLIESANSYTEVSPSGNGIHIWLKAEDLPPNGVRSSLDCLEMYSAARFMTVTGIPHGEVKPIRNGTDLAKVLHRSLSNGACTPLDEIEDTPTDMTVENVKAKLATFQNWEKIKELANTPFNSGKNDSSIDQALMNAIVFAAKNKELARAVFNDTPRAQREKWATRRDYQDKTIARAFDKMNDLPPIKFGERIANAMQDLGVESVGTITRESAHIQLDANPSRYRLVGNDDFAFDAQRYVEGQWRVYETVPCVGVGSIYGAPSAGKSFFAFDMACTIAQGDRKFSGITIEATNVVYLALEGQRGFAARVEAWRRERNSKLPDRLRMVADAFNATTDQDVIDLASVVPMNSVIFIDTLSRASTGINENDAKDIGALIDGAKKLSALTNSVVVFVHHTGKDSERGMRGHSKLLGDMDFVIEVRREGKQRYWKLEKSKDGEDGREYSFELKSQILGNAMHGGEMKAVTSATVVHFGPVNRDDATPNGAHTSERNSKQAGPLPQNQQLALRALQTVMVDKRGQKPVPSVTENEWLAEFADSYTGNEASAKRKFRDVKSKLIAGLHVREINGEYIDELQYRIVTNSISAAGTG